MKKPSETVAGAYEQDDQQVLRDNASYLASQTPNPTNTEILEKEAEEWVTTRMCWEEYEGEWIEAGKKTYLAGAQAILNRIPLVIEKARETELVPEGFGLLARYIHSLDDLIAIARGEKK